MAGYCAVASHKRAGRGKVHRFVSRNSSTRWRSLVSPILVRPVREQLEHDRLVRLLQAKSRRRFDAVANPGAQQNAPVRVGAGSLFPDLLLFSQDRGPAAAGGRRSGDRRVGQPSRSAGAMGAAVEAEGGFLPVCAREHGGCRAPAVRGQQGAGDRNLELPSGGRSVPVHVDASRARARPGAARRPPEAGAKRRPPQTRPTPGQAQAAARAPRRPGAPPNRVRKMRPQKRR